MANTIRIKRGLKADLSNMTLLAGELGIALDTQELYVGDENGNVKIVKGGASGAVESADKLTVARTISATGDATGSTSFDGSKNVEIALELANSGVTAGTYTKVTVDAKGRVTTGTNITVEDIGDLSDTLATLATKEELKDYVKTSEIIKHLVDGIAEGSIRTSGAAAESDDYSLGSNAIALGYLTKASGSGALAEGGGTIASASNSHAEGGGTKATANNAHAEGASTEANGYSSHAEGYGVVANGDNSHAEGYDTKTTGSCSHAEGTGTEASGENQHVQGKYNITDKINAHIVGNGTSSTKKSNAHTIDWDGNAWFAGDVYIKSTSGTNKDAGSKKLATEEYVTSSITNKVDKVEGKDLSANDFTNELKTKLEGLNNYDDTDIKASIENKVDKVTGKGLSTNDYTTAEKEKLESLSNYDDAEIKASIATKANSADVYSKTDMDTKLGLKADKSALDTLTETVGGKADAATTLAGYGIGDAYTKTEVDAKVASVYKYKGSVANEAALPTEGQVVGDVYNLEDTGMNVAWTGEGWDKLGSVVDLTPYLTKEDAGKTYAAKATTLAGYGITDAYTKTETDNLLANKLDATSVIDGGTF